MGSLEVSGAITNMNRFPMLDVLDGCNAGGKNCRRCSRRLEDDRRTTMAILRPLRFCCGSGDLYLP